MSVNEKSAHRQIQTISIEWPTLVLFLFTYVSWLLLTAFHSSIPMALNLLLLTLLVTLHSSLQHEVIHGHPTSWTMLNISLAFPALGLAVPYQRYEILHLQHHRNWLLTDPVDDSESYFVERKKWLKFSRVIQTLLLFNNTLFGRLLIGPTIMIIRFVKNELGPALSKNDIRNSWALHALGATMVIAWLLLVDFPVMLYLLCVAYPAISLLMLRAFSEHLPEEDINSRSAIIKTNWFMQLLYLNNNFHRVHHDHPEMAWYRLPELYRRNYVHHTVHVYNGYGELFRRYGFKSRFTVDHPFLARD